MRPLLIYIAGPYRGNIPANIQAAREMRDAVNKIPGCFAVTPHLLGDAAPNGEDDAFWLDGTLEVMRRCDAVMLFGDWRSSQGTMNEVKHAQQLSRPVFSNMSSLRYWSLSAPYPL
jgi:hypothetical protein